MVIIINGYPQSGKDTFVDMCRNYVRPMQMVVNLWTSTPAKNAITVLGWNGVKTPEARNLLSELKAKSNELFDTTSKYINASIMDIDKIDAKDSRPPSIIFIHSREPEEIRYLSHQYNAITVFIDRDVELEEGVSNASDIGVKDFDYAVTIPNKGTLEQLEKCAAHFMRHMMTDHLCGTCIYSVDFPYCSKYRFAMGNGRGFDNVVNCDGYK